MLRNLSLMRYWRVLPAFSLTISLIDMNGLIKRSAHGSRSDASKEAGPEPIDRPKRMIEVLGRPCTMVR